MTSPTFGEPEDAWTGFPAPRADFSEALPGYALPPGFGVRPPDAVDHPAPGPDPTTWVGHPSGPISLGSPLDPSTGHEVLDGIVDGVLREVTNPFAPGSFTPEPLTPGPSIPPGFGPADPGPAVPRAYVADPNQLDPYRPGGPPVVPAQSDPAGVVLPVVYPGDGSGPPIYAPVQRAYGPGPYTRRSPRAPGTRRTVSVDNNRCHLYAICQMEAPASFEVGRDGRLRYDMAPPTDRLGEVRQAARLCPMQAIKVRED